MRRQEQVRLVAGNGFGILNAQVREHLADVQRKLKNSVNPGTGDIRIVHLVDGSLRNGKPAGGAVEYGCVISVDRVLIYRALPVTLPESRTNAPITWTAR